MDTEILIFQCAGSHYGIPATDVSEVVRAVAVSPAPRMPDVMLGLINLRGQLVSVIDTRKMLGSASVPLDHTHQFVIVRAFERLIALHVDRALDLIQVDVAIGEATAKTEFGIVPILVPEQLISRQDANAIEAATTTSDIVTPANESKH